MGGFRSISKCSSYFGVQFSVISHFWSEGTYWILLRSSARISAVMRNASIWIGIVFPHASPNWIEGPDASRELLAVSESFSIDFDTPALLPRVRSDCKILFESGDNRESYSLLFDMPRGLGWWSPHVPRCFSEGSGVSVELFDISQLSYVEFCEISPASLR